MKNSGRITGIMLMLFMAGSLALSGQRGMRGMTPDSARMGMMRMRHGQMPMMQKGDSLQMRGMHQGMAAMQMNNMNQCMCPMCGMRQQAADGWRQGGMRHMGPGMRMMGRGMERQGMRMNGMPGTRPMAPGMRVIDNIPNLTDKQKKDIADLRLKQQVEMQKLRSDMQTKMKEMREAQRVKVMGLLNAEQKKWFEENSPEPLTR